MKPLIYPIVLLLFLFSFNETSAQGCVAIRGSSCGSNFGNGINLRAGDVLLGTGYRYFKSFRHFRGSHEETHRIEEGTQVINRSHFVEFFVNYGLTDRLFANAVLPFVWHHRSSMYEHGGNPPNGLGERHTTASSGLADARIGFGYWLFNPHTHPTFNYSLAAGVKLPTGRADYTAVFYNQGPNRDAELESVVDQSIQPGDGGTGITLDFQGFHALSPAFFLTTNLYYLLNHQATNGVLTRRGTSEFSCPDQYAARIGANYNTPLAGLSTYLGGRLEGVPSNDLIGSSRGYRRPGYAVSVEPGISYGKGAWFATLSLPVALVRNRTQSYQDKQRTIERGTYVHGDAAFADYLVNFSFSYRIGGGHAMPMLEGVPEFREVK